MDRIPSRTQVNNGLSNISAAIDKKFDCNYGVKSVILFVNISEAQMQNALVYQFYDICHNIITNAH